MSTWVNFICNGKVIPIEVKGKYSWKPKLQATSELLEWRHTVIFPTFNTGMWYGELKYSSQN